MQPKYIGLLGRCGRGFALPSPRLNQGLVLASKSLVCQQRCPDDLAREHSA